MDTRIIWAKVLTPCATFFSVRVRARDRARARTETTSFAKLLKIDS